MAHDLQLYAGEFLTAFAVIALTPALIGISAWLTGLLLELPSRLIDLILDVIIIDE
jgi:hypothetical protein